MSVFWSKAFKDEETREKIKVKREWSQGAAEPNQIFTCSIDGVGQSFSEKNECCFLRQIN